MEVVKTSNKMSAAMAGAINGAFAVSVIVGLNLSGAHWWAWIAGGAAIGIFNMLFVIPRERWTALRWVASVTLPGLTGYGAFWLVSQLF